MPDFGLKHYYFIVNVSSLLGLATYDVHLLKFPHSFNLDLMHLSKSQFLSSKCHFPLDYLPLLGNQLQLTHTQVPLLLNLSLLLALEVEEDKGIL